MSRRLKQIRRFVDRHDPVMLVSLTQVAGSSPREAGAEMLVAENDVCGTIGGGRLEFMAIARARAMLAKGQGVDTMSVPLGPEIGQCCGGHVQLQLRQLGSKSTADLLNRTAEADRQQPQVYVMGAGHVGRALADLLQHLPVQAFLVDVRAEELSKCDAEITKRHLAVPEMTIADAAPGSAFIIATHDHGLDFLLTMTALARQDASYVGLIGSATKRAKFKSWLAEEAPDLSIDQLICPIGANDSGDKRPAIIAAFVVAETLSALAAGAARPHLTQTTFGGPLGHRSTVNGGGSERGASLFAFQTGGVSYDWRQL